MVEMACGLFMLLRVKYEVLPTRAAWLTVGAFFLIRVLAVSFNWQTRSVLHEDVPDAEGPRGG
jgi:hypothetical protein